MYGTAARQHIRLRRFWWASLSCAIVLCAAPAARATSLTLWGADSLSGALGEIATDFTAATGIPVTTQFGSSGLLRQQIEAGARPDLFASADFGNPLKLQAEGLAGPVTGYATDQIVAVAPSSLGLTTDNLLATMLNPSVRLGTSTPIADPLGDYTEQVFAKADALVPGAKATLDAKALRLIGGPNSPPVPPGQNSLVYFLETTHQADLFLAYHTMAITALSIAPDLREIELPASLATTGSFGMTILNGADPRTTELADYILSPAGQAVLKSFGFGPPGTAVPEPASVALLAIGLIGMIRALRKK